MLIRVLLSILLRLTVLTTREITDGGGPGKFRGGVGFQSVFMPYDFPGESWDVNHTGTGSHARRGAGLAGGYPPS